MIVNPKDLAKLRSHHSDETIVLVGGVFDLLHNGHGEQLLWAKSLGSVLVVAIPDDQSVRKVKGAHRPVHTALYRAALLDLFRPVSYVVIGEKYDGLLSEIGSKLKPDIVALYCDAPNSLVKDLASELAFAQIVVNSQAKVTSSTEIIRKIKESK
jgi:D-beta-D-heptose 7-phosphate kinase/D-beta-D-heptose 1-phosphate adenosyltransferase